MSVKDVVSKDELMKIVFGLGKEALIALISAKLARKEIQHDDSRPAKKRSRLAAVSKYTRNFLVAIFIKEIIYERLKAKSSLKPHPGDFSWLLDYPFRDQLIDLRGYIEKTPRNAKVLDLGSGSGYFAIETAKHLSSGKVACVDADLGSLKQLQKNAGEEKVANIEFHRAYIEKLPFENESFDHIFLNMTFGQLPDKVAALTEIQRVLKKGGSLYITEILIDNYYCLRSTVLGYTAGTGLKAISEKGNLVNYTLIFSKS